MTKSMEKIVKEIVKEIKQNIRKVSRLPAALLIIALGGYFLLGIYRSPVEISVVLAQEKEDIKFQIYYDNPEESYSEDKSVHLYKSSDVIYSGAIAKDSFANCVRLRLDVDSLIARDEEDIDSPPAVIEVEIESIIAKVPLRSTYKYNMADNFDNIFAAQNIEIEKIENRVYFRTLGEDPFVHIKNTPEIILGAWSGISADIFIIPLIVLIMLAAIYSIPAHVTQRVSDAVISTVRQAPHRTISHYRNLKREQVLISFAIGFAFAFNLFFYGIMHIFMSNFGSFAIKMSYALSCSALVTAISCIIIAAFLISLPYRAYKAAAALFTGLILAVYIQGSFLNGLTELGTLTGDEINWGSFRPVAIYTIFIWAALIIIPVIALRFMPKDAYKKVLLIVCGLLSGMQAAALITFYVQNREDLQYEAGYYLSRDGAYEVSSTDNIIHFVIDRFDYMYIEEVREKNPEFFDELDGFTDFTNASSVWRGTFPSGIYMTTGIEYDFLQKRSEYFDYAWHNSPYIQTLQDAGYRLKYHMPMNYMFSNASQLVGVAENIRDGNPVPVVKSVIQTLTDLALYRSAPLIIKPHFWLPGVQFVYSEDDELNIATRSDYIFYQLLAENGISIKDREKNYFYVHLRGAHPPFRMTENLESKESSYLSQMKGCLKIIFMYLEEMRELGVYEDATILIVGDHGHISPRHIGFFVKPKGSAGTPLTQNAAPVSLYTNLHATILQSAGLEYSRFGDSAFDIDEDAEIGRYFILNGNTDDGRHLVQKFRFYGHANNTGPRDRNAGEGELIDSWYAPTQWNQNAFLPEEDEE